MTQTQDPHGEQDQYVVARALETLANDSRLGETALTVSVTGQKIFITGDVATPERREVITEVMSESFPDYEVANATSVYDMIETTEEERL
jgi:hypothetical protein